MAWHDALFDVLFPSRQRLEAAFEQAFAELEALGAALRRFEEASGGDGEHLPEASRLDVRRTVESLSIANLHSIRDLVRRRTLSRATEITRRIDEAAKEANELAGMDRPSGERVAKASMAAATALSDLRDLSAGSVQASGRIRILFASAYLVPIVASYLLGTWLRLGGGIELQEAAALAPRRAYVLVDNRFTLDPNFRSQFLSAFADYYFDRSKQAFEEFLEPPRPARLVTPSSAVPTTASWHSKPAPDDAFYAQGPPRASVTFVQDEEFIPDFSAIDDLLELDPDAESTVPLDRQSVPEPVSPESLHPRDPRWIQPPFDPPSDVLYQDWKLVFRNTSRSQPEFISSIEISAVYVAAEPFPWSELPVEPEVTVRVDEHRVRVDNVGSGPAVDLRCSVQDAAGLTVLESRLPRFVTGAMTGDMRPPYGIGGMPVTGSDLASVIYYKVEAPADPDGLPEGVEHRCIGWYRQLRTVEELCAVAPCSWKQTAGAQCSYETLVDATRRVATEEQIVLGADIVYYVDQTQLRDSDPCEPTRGPPSQAPTHLAGPLIGIASALIHLDPLAGPPEGSDLIVQRATVDLFGLEQGASKGRAVSINRFLNPSGVLVLEVRTRGASNGGYELAVSVNELLWCHAFEALAPPREHRSFLDDSADHPAELLQRFRAGQVDPDQDDSADLDP